MADKFEKQADLLHWSEVMSISFEVRNKLKSNFVFDKVLPTD